MKKQIEEQRKIFAQTKIEDLGYIFTYEDDQCVKFIFNGSEITFWFFTGWYSGKNIIDGRGIYNLLNQIKS